MTNFDVVVIGGGIAGLSVAYQLSKAASVLVLEQESQLAYHSTGRSAALFAASYGSQYPAISALSNASADFFTKPPSDLYATTLLSKRGLIFIAHRDKYTQLLQRYQELQHRMSAIEWLEPSEVGQKIPVLHADYCLGAIYDPDVFDVDVHNLLEGFRKGLLHNSSKISTTQRVIAMAYADNHWSISSDSETYHSPIVINAAGAWADQIASLAGVTPLGIQPLRRSAILVDPPQSATPHNWPMAVEFEESFYFKPDAGQLLVSPADETLSVPCDSRPEQLDIAMAADYVETALGYSVNKINHSWSGLRTFVEDRSPVVGYCDSKPGFFWLAALGGYGVQTAPAMGRFAAALALKMTIPEDITAFGMTPEYVSPDRFG